MPSGGQILIDCLAVNGVAHVFTVAGESFLAALDAMHGDDRIQPIACRNESGASMMAEASGKLTGRPGAVLVTRGPGAANAYAGAYVAQQDATPMLLLVGLPPRRLAGRDAFQAINVSRAFADVAKWTAVAQSAADLPGLVAEAVRSATSGLPGPVALGLPEDVLSEFADVAPVAIDAPPPVAPTVAQFSQIKKALARAERPIAIIGGGAWSAQARVDLARFAERFDLPVAAAFRRQDRLDNRHRCYVGHAGFGVDDSLLSGFKIADVVIALGSRLGDVTSQGFTLFGPDQSARGLNLIRIAADADRPDSAYPNATMICAHPVAAVAALADLELPGKIPPWGHWRRDLKAAYVATLRLLPEAGKVSLAEVVATLSETLPDDAIVTSGAGNYAQFLHRYFVYRSYPGQVAPISGSMGYGLPAAIAAKLLYPDRAVVAIAGDGCFQMTGQELATAVQFGVGVVVIIANNGALGTIRMHQERTYPGRVVATSLMNPDFVALAKSYGASAERVVETAQFAGALQRALESARSSRRPAVIELALDLDAISPGATLSAISARARRVLESDA